LGWRCERQAPAYTEQQGQRFRGGYRVARWVGVGVLTAQCVVICCGGDQHW
jgi:hypothetical protein